MHAYIHRSIVCHMLLLTQNFLRSYTHSVHTHLTLYWQMRCLQSSIVLTEDMLLSSVVSDVLLPCFLVDCTILCTWHLSLSQAEQEPRLSLLYTLLCVTFTFNISTFEIVLDFRISIRTADTKVTLQTATETGGFKRERGGRGRLHDL